MRNNLSISSINNTSTYSPSSSPRSLDSAYSSSSPSTSPSSNSERKFSLQKHERDLIAHSNVTAFRPLINEMAPEFGENVLSEHNLSIMEEEYLEIVQHLVDQLIYKEHADKYWRNYYSALQILYVLGLSAVNDGRYLTNLKQDLINSVTKSITVKNLVVMFEKIDGLQQNFIENFNKVNYLLDLLHNYCIEFTVVAFEHPKVGCSKKLLDSPIIIRNYAKIMAKVNLTKPTQIKLTCNDKLPSSILQALKKLYNQESTSDVKIILGSKLSLNCHKTVLASSSSHFRIWFEKNFDSNVYTPVRDDH
ncbi:predicted protein [Naegleria gruberi]|uniref:Predicted protein n=1 Tax=Naegleria gruberi TaxID=5762 RepID=D2VXX1_NAEGR|nr:uncharacterized protein NAEGRDRAFT_73907 [Naegleria gruberi]EFC38413.1 predicted protein [Naegleria gruberi]|eukprot:XP_002671157.1 predicted protein [Naegleria gruberi strain NEG-M]